uniref:Sugar phosphate phosphatase n=1 Tax=Heterorhabditis bacteriophora TaxID=37862 RepID=A0A1I7XU69_HETBA
MGTPESNDLNEFIFMRVTMDFDHTSGEIIAPKANGITKRTSVYYTIRDQCPKLLSRIIDNMHRRRRALMEMFGTDADWDVKSIIGELSEIRYRLMTDKPLQDISDEYSDYRVWNDILAKMRQKNGDESVTWYKSDWLFVECYLHRRIYGAVYKTKVLNNYDIFANQKVDEFTLILKEISDVVTFMISNANDIRVSAKHSVIETLLKIPSTVEAIHSHDEFILCSDLEKAIDIYLLNLK